MSSLREIQDEVLNEELLQIHNGPAKDITVTTLSHISYLTFSTLSVCCRVFKLISLKEDSSQTSHEEKEKIYGAEDIKPISEYSESPRIFSIILFSHFDRFEMNEINSYLIKVAMERHDERVTAHEVHDHFELLINGLFEGDKLNGLAFLPTKFFLCHKDNNSVYNNLSDTCTPTKSFRLQIKIHTNTNSIIEFFSMNTKSLINLKDFATVVQNSLSIGLTSSDMLLVRINLYDFIYAIRQLIEETPLPFLTNKQKVVKFVDVVCISIFSRQNMEFLGTPNWEILAMLCSHFSQHYLAGSGCIKQVDIEHTSNYLPKIAYFYSSGTLLKNFVSNEFIDSGKDSHINTDIKSFWGKYSHSDCSGDSSKDVYADSPITILGNGLEFECFNSNEDSYLDSSRTLSEYGNKSNSYDDSYEKFKSSCLYDSIGTSYKRRAISGNDSLSDSSDDSDEDSDLENSRISSRTESETNFCDSEADEYDDPEEDFDSNNASIRVNKSLETSVGSSKDSDSDNLSTFSGNLFELDIQCNARSVGLPSAYSTSRGTFSSLLSLSPTEHLSRIIYSNRNGQGMFRNADDSSEREDSDDYFSEHEDSDDFSEYEASDEFSDNEDFDDFFDYDIFSNKCSLKADELPEESIAAWKTKFKQMKDMESILSNSPEDSCYVCYESLKEIISTAELAVVPECNHILCLNCMEHCVTNSLNEKLKCPVCRSWIPSFIKSSSYTTLRMSLLEEE